MPRREGNLLIVRLSLALLLAFDVIGALAADDGLPARHNFDRYSAMADHSPFALATAVAVPAATPDFAKDLYVANAAHSAECDMATIASSSDHNFKKYLNTMVPVDGYSLTRIEWSEKVGETKVTIGKDGKFATLTFNQALLTTARSAGPGAVDEMRQSMSVARSPGAAQAPRARMRRETQHDTGLNAKPVPGVVPQDSSIRQDEQPIQRPRPLRPRQSGEKDQQPPS